MNREENEIRRLFRELKREDESLAPPFDVDWNAALSRMDEGRTPRRAFRLYAATAITLILLGGLALVLFRMSSRQPIPNVTEASVAAHAEPQTPPDAPIETPLSPVESSEAGRNQRTKRDSKTGSVSEHSKNVRRRLPAQSQTAVTLISQWRSPTDFLLNSPGEQLLRTVPRLNESLLEIKTVTLDGNN